MTDEMLEEITKAVEILDRAGVQTVYIGPLLAEVKRLRAAHIEMTAKLPEFVRDFVTGEILRDAKGEPLRISWVEAEPTSRD